MEPLFVKPPRPRFEKTAQEAQLPTNEAEWPAAILGELYKQAPYIEGNYVPEIRFNEKSPEDGYAVGTIILESPTSLPQSETEGGRGKELGIKQIQIPVIVRQFRLAPLDLVVLPNGEFRPQNKLRIRDALFKPTFTDGTSRGTRWNTWLDSLERYPLGTTGYFNEWSGGSATPYEKTSGASILSSLAPFDKVSMDHLTAELNDPFCLFMMKKNTAFRESIRKLGSYQVGRGPERALAESIPPTVIQVVRRPGATYFVKRANPEVYEPVEEEMDRGEALQTLGKDTVRAVDESGMITTSTSPVVREDLVEERVSAAKDFGLYRVKAKDGRQILGWVFPRVLDVDGTMLPMAVFTNGSENSLQGEIVGIRSGSASGLVTSKPNGMGTFCRTTGDDAVCLVPLEVQSASSTDEADGPGSKVYDVTTALGRTTRLHEVPGLKSIIPHPDSEGEYLIPADMTFIPLPAEGHVELIDDAEDFSKMAKLRRNSLVIRYDGGDRYTLTGCGLDKLADSEHVNVFPEQALFLSTIVGMHPNFAISKLARARSMSVVTVPNLQVVRPAKEVMAFHMAKVASGLSKAMKQIPRPVWLVKEAALLGDVDSVDKILSLGFITPHNVSVFLSYIPDFERTQAKVCEVLFAARMGGDEDLERASERTMHGMENVIGSLKSIGLENQTETDIE